VKVVIPRPDPSGLPVGGVGKVRLVSYTMTYLFLET
jgi:hypothetical protein